MMSHYGMHFGSENKCLKKANVGEITAINTSQKYIRFTHSSNTNRLNCTLNSQNTHFHTVAPELQKALYLLV